MIQQQPARREFPSGMRVSPRAVIFLVLLVLAVIFAAQNSERVDLTLFFWEFRLRLVWALLIFGLVGAVLGWMVPRLRSGSRR
jgi:uncharacterized integral membrane protein